MRPGENAALRELERASRSYAKQTIGNLSGERYDRRAEAREELRDALARLDAIRATPRRRRPRRYLASRR